jgi:hypothetical protein
MTYLLELTQPLRARDLNRNVPEGAWRAAGLDVEARSFRDVPISRQIRVSQRTSRWMEHQQPRGRLDPIDRSRSFTAVAESRRNGTMNAPFFQCTRFHTFPERGFCKMLLPFFYVKPTATEQGTSRRGETEDDFSVDHYFDSWRRNFIRTGGAGLVRMGRDARAPVPSLAAKHAAR